MTLLGIIGFFVYFLTWPTGLGLLWIPSAVSAAAHMKLTILRYRFVVGGPIRFWPLFLGVFVSQMLISILPLTQYAFGFSAPRHAVSVEGVKPVMALITTLTAVTAVVIAFLRRRPAAVGWASGRGFEVVPVSPAPHPPDSSSAPGDIK